MKDKQKGSGSRNHPDPKRKAETKRHIKDRAKELESKEAKLLVRFLGEHPEIDSTLQTSETLWTFLRFLKKSGHQIFHSETVFCVPFSHLVDLTTLR